MKPTILFACAIAAIACSRPDSNVDTTAAVTPTPAPTTVGATTATASGEVQTSTLVDPNTATEAQLTAAGIDATTASAVVAGRPYTDMVAVDKVLSGRSVTAEQRKAIYAKVWKPIDLNTASKAEILLIPGVGNRMLHEFEEYRPYKSMEQFRREIGKYVDKTELARLEQYVSIK
jgi:DNA uptake protein ComE-like DNA-binding protein